jgi:DNA-binding transcriptional LysR family regulator
MNIALAKTFLEIVSAGSFVRAAERLHVTHSAITMRIKALEDLLGKPLLIRSKTGVSLTAEGAQFHRHAEAMVRAWQLMKRQMSLAPGLERELSVGIDTSIYDGFAARWITRMRQNHPNIAVHCEAASGERLTQMLFQGWLDFCLTSQVQSRDGIKFTQLFDDPLVLVSTENRGWLDWDPQFIEIDWGDSYRTYIDNHFEVEGKTPTIFVSQYSVGLELAQEFGGSLWIPERCLHSGRLPIKLYPVEGVEKIQRPIYLAYSQDAVNAQHYKLSLEDFQASVFAVLDEHSV